VKKLLKIAALVSISTVYCLVLGIYSGNAFEARATASSPTESAFCSSFVSPNWFCYNQQSESLGQVLAQNSRTSLKNSFNQFSFCPLATGKLLFFKYLPYIYYQKVNTVWYKSTDIIFPFHYFW